MVTIHGPRPWKREGSSRAPCCTWTFDTTETNPTRSIFAWASWTRCEETRHRDVRLRRALGHLAVARDAPGGALGARAKRRGVRETGKSNPFVDKPELVEVVFGNATAAAASTQTPTRAPRIERGPSSRRWSSRGRSTSSACFDGTSDEKVARCFERIALWYHLVIRDAGRRSTRTSSSASLHRITVSEYPDGPFLVLLTLSSHVTSRCISIIASASETLTRQFGSFATRLCASSHLSTSHSP